MHDLIASVVIPTFLRAETLRLTLSSLFNQTARLQSFEVIVVDNAPSETTASVCREFQLKSGPSLQYLQEHRRGSHYARNTGFMASRSEILCLVDDDIVVDPSWLEALLAAYRDPSVGCAGGRIHLKWINGNPPPWLEPFKATIGFLDLGPAVKSVSNVNAGSFSIRKSILVQVGGYNPCNAPGDPLVGDGEVGLCRKVIKAGWKILYVPDAHAYHIQNALKTDLTYMRLRFNMQGKSDAYSYFQESSFSASMLVWKSICGTFRMFNHELRSVKYLRSKPYTFYAHLLHASYWKGNAWYLMYLASSVKLRQLVMRRDWLIDPPGL